MNALAHPRQLPIWRAASVRNFRLLWASEAVSVVGDQFQFVALSWLVISLTGSGLALGTVLIAIGVPRAFLLVPMGVIADRRPSRTLMLAAHVVRGAIVGAMAVLVLAGGASIPLLAGLGILFGAADAVYLPAQQAFLPRTVPAQDLPSANALLQGTFQLASIAGPPVAGIAIAAVGTGAAFTVDAVSFVLAALVVMLMTPPSLSAAAPVDHVPEASGVRPGPEAQSSFRDSVGDGIRYVLADRALLAMMLVSLVLNFAFSGPAAVGMPWLANRRFDAGPVGLGLMEAAFAVGALAGTLVAGSVRLERQGRIVVGGVALSGLVMAIVGIAGSLPAVVLAIAVIGLIVGYVNVVSISWIQARIEHSMVGRVMSLVMLMSAGVTPFSLALAGGLIDLNATATFVGSGTLVVLTALLAVAVRLPAHMDAAPRLAPVVEVGPA